MCKKERLIISGCLLGLCCRFDGRSKPLSKSLLDRLQEKFQLIPACPEQLGGLATPREPSEKCGDRFRSRSGKDVTDQYQKGAQETLKLAQCFGCQRALMKEKSPSCGFGQIYDGTFTGTLISGSGAAAELLFKNDIAVYGESRMEELLTTP